VEVLRELLDIPADSEDEDAHKKEWDELFG
jgi:hypothetical protein